jgi:hypothetical protein
MTVLGWYPVLPVAALLAQAQSVVVHPAAEMPTLQIIVSSFAAICAVYILKTVMSNDRSLTKFVADFHAHTVTESAWQDRLTENIATSNGKTHDHMNDISDRLGAVEQRLARRRDRTS